MATEETPKLAIKSAGLKFGAIIVNANAIPAIVIRYLVNAPNKSPKLRLPLFLRPRLTNLPIHLPK